MTALASRVFASLRPFGLAAILLAAVSAAAAVRWWHGEPAGLRIFLSACYGALAVTGAVIQVLAPKHAEEPS